MLPFRAGKFFRDFPDFLHRPNGVRELRERVRPDGAAPFLHRKAGALELRQRVRPDGAAPFLYRLTGARELRQRVRPFRAGSFPLNLSGGDSLSADGGNVPRPAAGTTPYPRRWAKRKDNLRFSFLFELLPFPCFLIWRRLPICDRFEKGNGRGFFLPCFSQPVRRVRYRSATHVIKSMQAQHDRVAQFVSALS